MSLTLDALCAVRAFIFDLDGVVWRGETAIPGAAACINALRAGGRHCLFATNNSARVPQFFADKLAAIGIGAVPEDVVTSATATAFHISRHFAPSPRIYVVGEGGVRALLTGIGARVLDEDDEETPAEIVVVGIDRAFTYRKLWRAQQLILGGATFIATNRDATFPVEGGVTPGAGSVVAAVETASGVTPLSMGKPQPQMVLGILEKLGLQAAQVAMVGDRLDTDIACGARAGVGTILVETGVSTRAAALAASGDERPDLIFPDLSALQNAVLGANS